MFDKMSERNIVSYNALISAYSRSNKMVSWAFQLARQLMQKEGLRPNGSTFTSLLQASSSLKYLIIGCMLHAQCFRFGFLNNICVQTSLLGFYANCGNLELSEEVFRTLVHKDVISWNSIIAGYMENGKLVEALKLFSKMLRKGAIPNQFTYSMVLNASAVLGDYDAGKIVHGLSLVSQTCFDLPLHNALLDMYCSCGDTQTAQSLFWRIRNPDLVSWNTMIAGYSENQLGVKALLIFIKLMRESVSRPDEYTYAAILSATGAFSASDYGKPLHAQIEKVGLGNSAYVGSTLISMYFSNGEPESAQKIFHVVLDKDVVLWTDMVSGHCRIGDGESAMRYFHSMLSEGHKVDSYALSSVLSACADLATFKHGEMIHSQAVKMGCDAEMAVCGSLVDMYAKSGDLRAAELAFSLVTRPDVRCWNSMLGGYSQHGKADEAFEVFDNILRQGLKPDQVTFISLLAACSHCGSVNKGKFFWNSMKENSLKPGPKHYSCIISLLCRAGLLEEAEEMIIGSPFGDEYIELWRILLSSCVLKGNMTIGNHAAEHILGIDAEDSATNVLLAKLYAIAGRWDSVAETRRKLREQIAEKDPGLSWIEIMNTIHVFSCGDQSHPTNKELEVELQKLLENTSQLETDEI